MDAEEPPQSALSYTAGLLVVKVEGSIAATRVDEAGRGLDVSPLFTRSMSVLVPNQCTTHLDATGGVERISDSRVAKADPVSETGPREALSSPTPGSGPGRGRWSSGRGGP